MIERIRINNYKSIHSAQIDLKMLNILIGPNGAGKSIFISFFDLTRHLLEQWLGSYLLEHGEIDSMLYGGRINSDSVSALINFGYRSAFEFKLKPIQNSNSYIECINHYNGDESTSMNIAEWKAEYVQNLLKSFTVYHFHHTDSMHQLSRVGDNEYLRHDGSNLAAFLYKLKITDIKAYNLIEGMIRTVVPYFKEFKLIPNKIMDGYIGLEWEERDTEMYLDATNFSDGTLRFIALTTLLLQPNAPKTIIIDEPELGLHPAAIIKLGALIKRASRLSQIIIATQSIELVNNFSVEDLIVVGRSNNQSIFNRLKEEDYAEWLKSYSVGELLEKNIIGGQP